MVKMSSVSGSVYRLVYPEGDVTMRGGLPSRVDTAFNSSEPPCTSTSGSVCRAMSSST